MKIAVVSARSASEFSGGTELVVRAQARELAARGHSVRWIAGSDGPWEGADIERREFEGVPLSVLPRHPHEAYDLTLDRPRLAELVRLAARGADIVHVHGWDTLSCGVVRALSRAAPVVVTLHDHLASCPRFFRLPKVAELVCPPRGEHAACARCIAEHTGGTPTEVVQGLLSARQASFEAELAAAALVFVPSAAHHRGLERALALPSDRVRVLRHGLCQPISRLRPARTFDGERPLVVLHFGNRSRAKGTLDLVDAIAALPPGQVELVLGGPALEAGLDREIAGRMSGHALAINGSYGPEWLVEQAGRSDLAAFPSRLEESYALVVEEALALGLPAWVSDRGAAREFVFPSAPERSGHAGPGLVLPAADPASWTRAFRDVIAFPKMLALQRAAVPRAVRTAADAALELELAYTSLLRTPRALAS